MLDPRNSSIIIYYHYPEFEKHKNIYSQKRMIDLGSFLSMNKDSFEEFISSQEKYIKNNEITQIKDKINSFCSVKTPTEFEKEIIKLFLLFKEKNKEIELMLKFFNSYKGLFISKKPIHIGGNHPADIEFIDLFEYFNQLFNLDENRGADTKRFLRAYRKIK